MRQAFEGGHTQSWHAIEARGRVPARTSDVPQYVEHAPHDSPDAVFGVYAPDLTAWVGSGTKVMSLPYFFDFLMIPPEAIRGVTVCYPTEYARALHKGHDGPVTGTPIREHLNGPSSRRPLHVCFTMKRGVPERWRHSIRGRWWYFEHMLRERHWAAENHLRFVIKTRRKHRDPWWLRMLGPVVNDDGAMCPDVSQWLLRDATAMAHFHSGAVVEAVIQDVPVIRYVRPERMHLDWLAAECQPPTEFYRPELIGRDEYLRRFVGPADASARILEVALG